MKILTKIWELFAATIGIIFIVIIIMMWLSFFGIIKQGPSDVHQCSPNLDIC